MEFLTPHLHFKSMNDDGEISGYASVFDIVDGYHDIVVKGSFSRATTVFANGKKPKLLWQHDINFPIGVVDVMREDDYGLFIKCRLLLELPKAKEVYYLLKNKAIDGFSIGYRIKDSYFSDNKRYLTDIDLLEISIVTFPACPSATVEDIKAYNDILRSIKDISYRIREKINEQRYTSSNF
ncbi:MAG: HK97 family phage prohead protease [Holosporaceae bacterium]|jgi:HK97 family phage prohead protease|nr:HK97 family phage prohead protease [Holosporaceae bacterium]